MVREALFRYTALTSHEISIFCCIILKLLPVFSLYLLVDYLLTNILYSGLPITFPGFILDTFLIESLLHLALKNVESQIMFFSMVLYQAFSITE